jgi:hypothetical protein
VGRRRVLGSGKSDDDRLIAEVITAVREPRAAYPVAISLVALKHDIFRLTYTLHGRRSFDIPAGLWL